MEERTHRKNVLVHDEHELYHSWSDVNLSGTLRESLDRQLREDGHDPDTLRWAVDKALEEGYSIQNLKDLGSYQELLELVRGLDTTEDLEQEHSESKCSQSNKNHD